MRTISTIASGLNTAQQGQPSSRCSLSLSSSADNGPQVVSDQPFSSGWPMLSRTLTRSIIGEWPPTGPLVTAIFCFLLSDHRIICHKSGSRWGGRDVGTIVASRNTTTPEISDAAAASHFLWTQHGHASISHVFSPLICFSLRCGPLWRRPRPVDFRTGACGINGSVVLLLVGAVRRADWGRCAV